MAKKSKQIQNIRGTIIKSWFSRIQKNSSSRFAEKESENLTDSTFIVKYSQQLKKQQPKLLIKSFTED